VPDSVDGRFDLWRSMSSYCCIGSAKVVSQPNFVAGGIRSDVRRYGCQSARNGVSDLAVGGRVKTMAQAFFGRIALMNPV